MIVAAGTVLVLPGVYINKQPDLEAVSITGEKY
jgi:hypothetical protein